MLELTKLDGETVAQHYSRLYRSEEMRQKYATDAQRHTVCMRYASEDMTGFEYSDFWYSVKNHGLAEKISEDNFIVPPHNAYLEGWLGCGEELDVPECYTQSLNVNDYAFTRKHEAEKVAEKLGMTGVHSHRDKYGQETWMPGKDMEEFESWFNEQTKGSFVYRDPVTDELFTYNRRGNYNKNGRRLIFVEETKSSESHKILLDRPFLTPKGPKEFAAYTKSDTGNIFLTRFDNDESGKYWGFIKQGED